MPAFQTEKKNAFTLWEVQSLLHTHFWQKMNYKYELKPLTSLSSHFIFPHIAGLYLLEFFHSLCFVIPQQTQPLLCVIFFLWLGNRCWAHLLLWCRRKQTSGCASTPYISYSSCHSRPFWERTRVLNESLLRILEAATLCEACFPSCSRITNVSRVPSMTIHYKCIPARGMSSTRDVLQSTDPSALVFYQKNSEKEKQKIAQKLVKCKCFKQRLKKPSLQQTQ